MKINNKQLYINIYQNLGYDKEGGELVKEIKLVKDEFSNMITLLISTKVFSYTIRSVYKYKLK